MWVWVRNYSCAGSVTRWRSPGSYRMTLPLLHSLLLDTEQNWGAGIDHHVQSDFQHFCLYETKYSNSSETDDRMTDVNCYISLFSSGFNTISLVDWKAYINLHTFKGGPSAFRTNRSKADKYPLPSTQSSHTLRVRAATSGRCLLTSAQRSTQSHPWSMKENFTLRALVPHSAVGFWTSSQADLRDWWFHLL